MWAFVDEAGNTGKNVLDANQPVFATAAMATKSDFDVLHAAKVKALADRLGVEELHGRELGIGGIERIAYDLAAILKKVDARFFFSRVEKRYNVAAKMVDTIFDAGENLAVPWHVYNLRPLKISLVYKFVELVDDGLAQEFWDSLMSKKRDDAYRRFVAVCDELLRRAPIMRDQRARQIITQAVEWVRANPREIFLYSESKDLRYGHLPNMVGFANLLDGVERQSNAWDRPVKEIRHDEQGQFKRALANWHEMFSKAKADPIHMPGGEQHTFFKVFGSRFTMMSSKLSAGIQVVDVVLWTYMQLRDRRELPLGMTHLMATAGRRAYENDFSFDGVARQMDAKFGHLMKGPMDPEQMKKAQEIMAISEQRRQQGLVEFEQRKLLSSAAGGAQRAT